jgi:hypothetical protein
LLRGKRFQFYVKLKLKLKLKFIEKRREREILTTFYRGAALEFNRAGLARRRRRRRGFLFLF